MHSHVKDFWAIYDQSIITSNSSDNEEKRLRFYNMIQMFKLTKHLNGSICECGCWRGQSSYLMCSYMTKFHNNWKGQDYYIIDSFEGLSEPCSIDKIDSKFTGKFSDTSMGHVNQVLSKWPKVTIYDGWIPEVFSTVSYNKYKFVHIDVDLYEPTLECLKYFWSKMVTGGMIVIDDYGWPMPKTFKGCSVAVDQFCNTLNMEPSVLTTYNAVLIKGS